MTASNVPFGFAVAGFFWFLATCLVAIGSLFFNKCRCRIRAVILAHQILASLFFLVFFFHDAPISIWFFVLPLPIPAIVNMWPKETESLVLSVFLGALVVGSSLWFFLGEDEGFEGIVTRRRAERVMESLERYKQEHARYPQKLDNLVPQYIDRIPLPMTGTERYYYSVGKNGLTYNLQASANWGMYHEKTRQGWIVPHE